MKFGIVAGSGLLPLRVAEYLVLSGKEVYIALIDQKNTIDYSRFNVERFKIGQIGGMIDFFKDNDVSELVIIGSATRPNFLTLKVDKVGRELVLRILKSSVLGDDKILRTVADFIESFGFTILSPKPMLINSTINKGVVTSNHPSLIDLKNIEYGIKEAKKLGAQDKGQAVVVLDDIVKKEDRKGTDSLISRSNMPGGVLVKMMKPEQDIRLDIPTIGEETVRMVAKNKLHGIAIESGEVIVVDIENVIKLADDLGIFLIGV